MAKKKRRVGLGKTKYISKGIHKNDSKSLLNACRADFKGLGVSYLDTVERLENQYNAWVKGKNVVLTIDNPNPNETKARKIKVKAFEIWGDPKDPKNHFKF